MPKYEGSSSEREQYILLWVRYQHYIIVPELDDNESSHRDLVRQHGVSAWVQTLQQIRPDEVDGGVMAKRLNPEGGIIVEFGYDAPSIGVPYTNSDIAVRARDKSEALFREKNPGATVIRRGY